MKVGTNLLAAKLQKEKEIELFELEIRKAREPEDDPQIIVDEKELQTYLHDGWMFVAVLPSGKILVRK